MTELVRSLSEEELRTAVARSSAVSTPKTPEQDAATSVWYAASAELEDMGSVHCEDVDIAEAVAADFPEHRGVRQWAMAGAWLSADGAGASRPHTLRSRRA